MSIVIRFLSVLILISFSGSGQILTKKGVLTLDLTGLSLLEPFTLIFRVMQNGWLLGGIFFLGLTLLLYLLILSRTRLNIIYPIMVSGTIILVTAASQLFFNEILSLSQIFGIFVIIFGIFLMFLKKPAAA